MESGALYLLVVPTTRGAPLPHQLPRAQNPTLLHSVTQLVPVCASHGPGVWVVSLFSGASLCQRRLKRAERWGGGWGNEKKGRVNVCMRAQTVGGPEASRTWKKTEGSFPHNVMFPKGTYAVIVHRCTRTYPMAILPLSLIVFVCVCVFTKIL